MTPSGSVRFLVLSVACWSATAWADNWQKYDEAGSRAREQKNYTEADKLYRAALKEAAKSEPDGMGEKTARTMNNLALNFAEQGRFAEGQPLLEKAVAILEKKKPQSREMARACGNLGWVYQHLHNYNRAEQLYTRALDLRQRILDPDEYDITLNLEDLALLYQVQGKYAQAEVAWSRDLEIWQKLDATGRPGAAPFVAHGLYDAGIFYYFIGKYLKAAPILRRSLVIQETILGPEHEDIASTLQHLGSIEKESSHAWAAEQFFRRACTEAEKKFGPHHLRAANAMSDLATLYIDQKRFSEAEPLLNDALAIFNNASESDKRSFGGAAYWTLYARGILCLEQGKFTDAASLLRRSLDILENDMEEAKQPYMVVATAVVIASQGRMYRDQDRFQEAEPLFARALTILDTAGLGEHPKAAAILNDYAALLRKTGRQAEAEAMRNRAEAIRALLASVGSGG